MMLRARFVVAGGDERPAVWPIPHPYWCTGYNADDLPYVVAYVDSLDQLHAQWPDAEQITTEEVEDYTFTDRFPPPHWWTDIRSATGEGA